MLQACVSDIGGNNCETAITISLVVQENKFIFEFEETSVMFHCIYSFQVVDRLLSLLTYIYLKTHVLLYYYEFQSAQTIMKYKLLYSILICI